MPKDTDDKIERVYDYVDKEVREVKTDLGAEMKNGFDRVEAAVEKWAEKAEKTNIAVAKVSTEMKSLATSTELEKKASEIKDDARSLMQGHLESKHGSYMPLRDRDRDPRKVAAVAAGGVTGAGAAFYGLYQLVTWIKELF